MGAAGKGYVSSPSNTRRGALFFAWACTACLPVGGVLWALTPLGIELAQGQPKVGVEGFWRVFSSSPLMIAVGLLGFGLLFRLGVSFLRTPASPPSRLVKAGLAAPLLGIVLVVSGNVAQFWLGIDDRYLLTAPAHLAFEAGLVVFAAGSALFAASATRIRLLPIWASYPLAASSVGGLFAFASDLGAVGVTMWIFFGLSWAWVGFSLFARGIGQILASRRS